MSELMNNREKVTITCALTGGGYFRGVNEAFVPFSPEEIAEDAYLCYKAGASIIHIHARDADGTPSADVAVFQDIIERIRAKCDVLIQTTNGIGNAKDPVTGEEIVRGREERLALLNMEPGPDLYGIASGTIDFWAPGQLEVPFVNDRDFTMDSIKRAFGRGTTIEFEMVEVNIVHRLKRMADEGVFDANADNLWFLHGFGIANTPCTPRAMVYSVEEQKKIFPNGKWGIVATEPHAWNIMAMGIAMGCDVVRTGLEDSRLLADGSPARRNHVMVEQAVALARSLGREPRTPQETAEMFRIRHRTLAAA